MQTTESKNPKAKPDEHDADKHASGPRPNPKAMPDETKKASQTAGVVPGKEAPPSKEDPTPPQQRDSKIYPEPKTPPNVQTGEGPSPESVEPKQVRSVDSTKDMDPVHTPESQLKGLA